MSHRHQVHHDSHSSGLTDDQIETYEAKFAEWQTVIYLCCIPTGVLFVLISHYVLSSANLYLANSDGLTGLRILFWPVLWWFFPGFGAISACFEITLQIWSLFVGRKVVDLYVSWDSLQPKKFRGGTTYYDARSWLRWMTLLIAMPICVLTGLALPMHTAFTKDGIHEFGYAFAAPKAHSYTDIRRIATVHGVFDKHSKLIRRPYCVIDFKDGYRWNQHQWDDSHAGTALQIQAILAAHTDAQVTDILVIEDLPGLNSQQKSR